MRAADRIMSVAPRLSPKDALFVWNAFLKRNVEDANLFHALADTLEASIPSLSVTDAVELLYGSESGVKLKPAVRHQLVAQLFALAQRSAGRDLLWIMQAVWENRGGPYSPLAEEQWCTLVKRVHRHVESFGLTETTIAWRMLTEAAEDEDRDASDSKAESMALLCLDTRRDILLRRLRLGDLLPLLQTQGEFLGPEVLDAFLERLKSCSTAQSMDREKLDPLLTLRFIPHPPREFIAGACHWAARRRLDAREMWEIARAAHLGDLEKDDNLHGAVRRVVFA